jgi:hypothetical protein
MRLAILAAIAVALPAASWAQAVDYANRSGTITAGGTAQALAPAWSARKGCLVQNLSAGDLWISEVGTAAAASPSIKVPAGSQYICMSPASGQALSIFGATTAQSFAAREW